MPEYTVRDPRSNKTVVLRGESPPTEAELQQIFSTINGASDTPMPAAASRGMLPQSTATTSSEAPAPPTGSAVGRFVSNAAERLNPVTMAQGAYQAVRHPVDTAQALVQAQGEQFTKARENLGQGRYSEAFGHGMAGVVPLVGPLSADIGEQIGSGDVAGGLGALAGTLAPLAATKAIGAASNRVAPALRQSAERKVVQALGATKERFKAIAAKRAPEIIARGLGGSRETLRAQAAGQVAAVGQQIDDVLAQHGGKVVNPQPVVSALEDAKTAFQTTRQVPLTEAIAAGLEKSPGARVVGELVEIPVVYEPRAVAQLSHLQRVIESLGPEARVDQLVAIRRTWDKIVADAGGFSHRAPGAIGQPLKDISEAAAKRTATTAIRQLLNEEVPSLTAINHEFGFWKDLNSVLRQTLDRTQPQGPGLGARIRESAGVATGALAGSAGGGPILAGAGAIVGGGLAKAVDAVFTSPRWKFVSARLRSHLADALASGNPERISEAVGRVQAVTGGGTALTSPSESRTPTRGSGSTVPVLAP